MRPSRPTCGGATRISAPGTEDRKPRAQGQRPEREDSRPRAWGQRPAREDRKPRASGQRPRGEDRWPSASGQRPGGADRRRRCGDVIPRTAGMTSPAAHTAPAMRNSMAPSLARRSHPRDSGSSPPHANPSPAVPARTHAPVVIARECRAAGRARAQRPPRPPACIGRCRARCGTIARVHAARPSSRAKPPRIAPLRSGVESGDQIGGRRLDRVRPGDVDEHRGDGILMRAEESPKPLR